MSGSVRAAVAATIGAGALFVLGMPAAALAASTVITVESVPQGAPNLYEQGWHIDPGAAEVTVDGLRVATGADATRVLYGVQDPDPATPPTVVTPDQLLALIVGAQVEVVEGEASLQVPILFGDPNSPQFTTIRSQLITGPATATFAADSPFQTTSAIGSAPAGAYIPLSEIIDGLVGLFGPQVASVAPLAFGVQANADANALVRSVTWDDTQYVFAAPAPPTAPPAPVVPVEPAAPEPPAPGLPETGVDATPWVFAAAALVVAGAAGLVFRRRTRDARDG